MTRRILVVGGAGHSGMSAAVALALADLSFKVVQADGFVLETRAIEPGDLPASVRLTEPSHGHGWYQQFAGKKGRHPRY